MKRIAAGIAVFILAGCTDNMKVPADIIPFDKMETIMWDMVKADRFTNNYILSRRDSVHLPDNKKDAAVFYERVFNLHGITRNEFLKSYKFYLGRPDMMKLMFDSISARGDRMREELYRVDLKKDSLLRLRKDSSSIK